MIGGRSSFLRAGGRHLTKVLSGAVTRVNASHVSETQVSESVEHLTALFTRTKTTGTEKIWVRLVTAIAAVTTTMVTATNIMTVAVATAIMVAAAVMAVAEAVASTAAAKTITPEENSDWESCSHHSGEKYDGHSCDDSGFTQPDSSSVSSNSNSKLMSENMEFPTLEKLGLLGKQHIQIRNPGHVDHLLSNIVGGGFNKLQVIADHDRTLSRAHYKNERIETCHGIMDNSPLMPPYYREEANKLFNKYYPIEVDPIMTEEEKIPLMIEWYENIHKLLLKCGITRTSVSSMVQHSNVRLRDGTEELFSKLKSKSVPILIFSAGMGDILEEVLRHFDVYNDNVKVVSNFFEYDEQGNVTGFKSAIIHMFNKNENAIHESDYFKKISGRNNVILLGDSLGDIKMACGVPQPNNVLKIGFLNDKIEERMETYKKNFDIVLVDDQTMDVCNNLIDLIMK